MTLGGTIGLGLMISLFITAFVLGITISVRSVLKEDETPKIFLSGLALTMVSGTVLFTIGTGIVLAILRMP